MKALILTVTSGQGHNAVAKATASLLEERGVETEVLDLYRGRRKFWAWVFNDAYFLALKLAMPLANFVYHRGQLRRYDRREKNFLMDLARMDAAFLKEKLESSRPDLVVCTHVLPAAILDLLKGSLPERMVTGGIVTDYGVHPYWECAIRNDFCILPAEELIPDMEKRGWKREQLFVFPVPVRPAFYEPADREQLREKLGLNERPVLLLMGGGEGSCNSKKMIRRLLRTETDFQIVNICGRNRKMKKKIDRLLARRPLRKKVINLGFTDNVAEWMGAADLYLGKVGMISSTEAVCRDLPMVAVRRLAWQEQENAAYLASKGGLCRSEKRGDEIRLTEEILGDPARLRKMRECQQKLNRPKLREALGDFLVSRIRGGEHEET